MDVARDVRAFFRADLTAYRVPVQIAEALTYLLKRSADVRVLMLYQHFFPAEFAVSGAARRPEPTRAYSDAEWEFFQLVNDRLFAINLDWMYMLDEDGPEAREEELSPWAGLNQEWWDMAWEDLSPGEAVLAFMLGMHTPASETVVALDSPLLTALVTEHGPTHLPFDVGQLRVRCAQAAEPLCHLPEALEFINHETGNGWIDYSADAGVDIESVGWSVAEIEGATRGYQEAQEISRVATGVIDWMDADPAHLEEVIRLWIACLKPQP